MEPYTEVLLSWNVVERRIRKLIEEDRYLSPEGKEAYAAYKEDEARKAMQKAQEKIERDTKVSCKEAIEKAIAEKFDGYRLPKLRKMLFVNMEAKELLMYLPIQLCTLVMMADFHRITRNGQRKSSLMP